MSGIVENFIRRIEKLVDSYPTVPTPGTNHIDDNWLSTDIYPGELAINLLEGRLYSSNGTEIIVTNRENAILGGLVVSQDTSGVNKLSVSSGYYSMYGAERGWTSSGTDILLPINTGIEPELYFINMYSSLSYPAFSSISLPYSSVLSYIYSYIPNPDEIFLGMVIVPPGATGSLLHPLSVSKGDQKYPIKNITPAEFLRELTSTISLFEPNHLYFPGQIIVDYSSDTQYISKTTFISDSISIAADITSGNVAIIAGGTGASGGTYTATSVGGGYDVYESTVANQFRFRSLIGSSYITLGYTSSTIKVDINPSQFVLGLTAIGAGSTLYAGASSSIHRLRSLTAGSSRLTISTVGDNVVIDIPAIGTTAQGVMLGTTGPAIYAGMSGDNLSFRRILGGTGMSVLQNANDLTISTTARNNNGVNLSGGSGLIYFGMSGDNLAFRSLTAGSNVSIVTSGNNIIISSSAGSGTITGGTNIGATGSTVGQIFTGLSGTNLTFKSIVPGYGIALSSVGNDVIIDTTIVDGAQGRQGPVGPQGRQGPQGLQGFQGFQGFQGANGTNGTNGAQGRQGFRGFQGDFGPQGMEGAPAPITPLTPIDSIEIYDSGVGWTVNSGQDLLITFDQTGVTDAIYTINQLSPFGSGTVISSTEPGRYFFSYTITGIIASAGIIECVLYNYTTSTPVPGTKTKMLEFGGTGQVSVTSDALIDYNPGDEYGVLCSVSITSPGTSISGVADSSSLSMIKLTGNKGDIGPQGPKGDPGPAGTGNLNGTGASGYLPVFTEGNSLTSSSIFQIVTGSLAIPYAGKNPIIGNTVLSMQRSQTQIDVVLGNPGYNQPNIIMSDNDFDGLEIKSKGRFGIFTGATYSTKAIEVNNGKVGIGAFGTGGSGPQYRLDVNNQIFVGDSLAVLGESGLRITGNSSSQIQWFFESNNTSSIIAGEGQAMQITDTNSIILSAGGNSITQVKSGMYYTAGVTSTSGEISKWGSGTVSAGLVYYYNPSGSWELASGASSSTSSGLLGIASASGISPGVGMLLRGISRFSSSSYTSMGTTGAPLYLSSTSPGEFTEIAPTGTGKIVRIIGYVKNPTNDEIYFCPDNSWIQII